MAYGTHKWIDNEFVSIGGESNYEEGTNWINESLLEAEEVLGYAQKFGSIQMPIILNSVIIGYLLEDIEVNKLDNYCQCKCMQMKDKGPSPKRGSNELSLSLFQITWR